MPITNTRHCSCSVKAKEESSFMAILIKGISVFNGAARLPGTFDVIVENNIIARIKPTSGGPVIEKYGEVISGENRTLLPGLIDLHVHLTWSGGPDPAADICREDFGEHLMATVAATLRYLPKGITSVRDLGSPEDCSLIVERAVTSGQIPGPRIYGSGMSIIMTGGHDPFHGLIADGRDEVLKAVRTQVAKGARVIKISATGGVYGRERGEGVDDVELRREEVEMIVDESHRRNLPVTAHAIGKEGIQLCLNAGIDCIEHGHGITESMAREMREKGIAHVPTFYIYQHLSASNDIPEYAREKARNIIAAHGEALKRSYRNGVTIGAGSDAGSPRSPHPSLLKEIKALNAGGLSGEDALKAATRDAAKILGESHRLGSIREGYLADLVVVRGDPLEDWDVLDEPLFVIKDGKLVFKN